MTVPEGSDPQPILALPIKGADPRSAKYQKIADVHRQVVEAKWRARTAGAQMTVQPVLLIHLEEAVAFLAEELLRAQCVFDKDLQAATKPEVKA